MLALEIVFWAAVGLLVHTHAGYPLSLWLLSRIRSTGRRRGSRRAAGRPASDRAPGVSLIVPAHDEADVIEARIGNVLALDYPREALEIIVSSDGSTDATVELARRAGADLVLDLPRAGKIAAQNAAVERANGELLAFSDANALWRPRALAALAGRFGDPRVGYACGQVVFRSPQGDNLEGAYWRYEMAVRALESGLGGVTAGNGAIYAVRREAYVALPPSRSHDLSFPFELTRRGWRAVYEPAAVAEEKLVPTIEGEFARKRRMMRGLWDIVIADRMISPRSYPPLYLYQLISHRLLRYASPALHLVALAANLALLGEGWVYAVTLALQGGLLAGALLGSAAPLLPFRIARYYVLVTASIAAGLWDRMRQGPPAAWERAEGTR